MYVSCFISYKNSNTMYSTQFVCIVFLAYAYSVTSLECPENEYYDECGTSWPATCENPTPRHNNTCRRGCFCRPGLVRDIEINECVPLEECPGVEPGPCKDENEEFKTCGPVCFETCTHPKTECEGCKQGCFCKDGFVRDDFLNYKCVPRYQCPPNATKNR